MAFAFPVSLTTTPFPDIAAYGGLLSLPEQPKRKASSLICQPMVSHSPVCKLHTHRINSLKASIICTAPNQLFRLIGSRHTRSHGMFSFGKSRHIIPVTKLNLLKISIDSTKAPTRMKYTVCCAFVLFYRYIHLYIHQIISSFPGC